MQMPAQMVWGLFPLRSPAGDRLCQPNQSRTSVHHYQERVVCSGLVYMSVSPLCLYGQAFQARTDHNPLRWLHNFREAEGQVTRWLAILSEYNFRLSIVQMRSTKMLMLSLTVPASNVVMHQSKQWQPMLLQLSPC